MKFLNEKLKSISTALLAIFFLAAVSCGTATNEADSADEAEATEQTEAADHEHPGGEHPSATDEVEEADSTVVEMDTTSAEAQ